MGKNLASGLKDIFYPAHQRDGQLFGWFSCLSYPTYLVSFGILFYHSSF